MARPRKQGLEYFAHDTNAIVDPKIEALRARFGNDGYAFYFILLEIIYKEKNFELKVFEAENKVSDAETTTETKVSEEEQEEMKEEMFAIIANKIMVDVDKFEKMLNVSFRWGLFDRDKFEREGVLTSQKIKERAGVVEEKRIKMRQKYNKEKDEVSDAETKVSETKTPVSEHKGKERKGKESTTENKFSESDFPYKAAEALYKYIRKNNPKAKKVSEKQLQNWALEIDRLQRIDGFTEDEIRQIIKFSQNDTFWWKNICSGSSLRKKATRLYAEIIDQEKNKQGNKTKNSYADSRGVDTPDQYLKNVKQLSIENQGGESA